jgi:hypothetical protein
VYLEKSSSFLPLVEMTVLFFEGYGVFSQSATYQQDQYYKCTTGSNRIFAAIA